MFDRHHQIIQSVVNIFSVHHPAYALNFMEMSSVLTIATSDHFLACVRIIMNDRVHIYLDQTILLIFPGVRNESPRVVQVSVETKS